MVLKISRTMIQKEKAMGAKEGNKNAEKRGGTRVPACLSISDEKGRLRKSWAIALIMQENGIEHPTDQQISRFVKDWCYAKIDENL